MRVASHVLPRHAGEARERLCRGHEQQAALGVGSVGIVRDSRGIALVTTLSRPPLQGLAKLVELLLGLEPLVGSIVEKRTSLTLRLVTAI